MHAYYEIETEIPNNHQLNISLPNDIPAGKAKIAVIYELPIKSEKKPQNYKTVFLKPTLIIPSN